MTAFDSAVTVAYNNDVPEKIAKYVIRGVDPKTGAWDRGSIPDLEGPVHQAWALPRVGDIIESVSRRKARVVKVMHCISKPDDDAKDTITREVLVGVVPES
jgi:hypothetical protein